jgi:IS30 family transposase
MSGYTQLTEGERNQIYALNKQGLNQRQIAESLQRHPSTIGREMARNRGQKGYRPKQAHHLARERRANAASHPKMTEEVIAHVEEKLRLEWSPETISATMQAPTGIRISHERIYQHVYEDRRNGGDLHTHLRHGRTKRRKRCNPSNRSGRGHIKNRRDIDERPSIVDTRLTTGHWEIDTIIGQGQQGAAVTIVERKTRFTLLAAVPDRSASSVSAATIRLLEPYRSRVESITADNGKEFAGHETIAEKLGADFYFAKPYHSWERGTNENTNGLIRQYLPKSEPLDTLSPEREDFIMERLNNRPRKVLGYDTPERMMSAALSS